MAQASTVPPSTGTTHKWVYLFEEGSADMRNLLGGKGAGCAGMTRAGLPVPPGFTITTEACVSYYSSDKQFPAGMWEQVLAALAHVEQKAGKKLGDVNDPLLVSVRSGARVSMPGMMDTVLNLGLNDQSVQGLARLTNNERFALDAYRRFISMFGRIVQDIPTEKFDKVLDEAKERAGVTYDPELQPEHLRAVVAEYKKIVKAETGKDFPTDPLEQLRLAIGAVFSSWMGKRAVDYRRAEKLPDDWGTAVNVQTMVFGNMGADSGTGVAFTRDPNTGEHVLYGNFLANAQGEDVVAGIRNAEPISALNEHDPEIYAEFVKYATQLEKAYRDMQDLEFTIERGTLYMLQTRSGKRTGRAAVKIARDLVEDGLISKDEALMRVEPRHVVQLLLPRFDEKAKAQAEASGKLIAKGVAASPGAAVGQVVFDPDVAEEKAKTGARLILVRPETAPDDFHGMIVSQGILTSRGGTSSHAAVVARGLGKPCIVGAESVRVNVEGGSFSVNGATVKEGEVISIDGTTGEIMLGAVTAVEPKFEEDQDLQTILAWADERRRLGTWANADRERDAARARELGAEGIGLCRTEHMFEEAERLPFVRQMILNAARTQTGDEAARKKYLEALDKLLGYQKGDFKGLLRAMDGLPVIIRLLDPPLHEFLPKYEELLVDVTEMRCKGVTGPERDEKERMLQAVASMREQNPMLGLRGCRLGLMFPEINEMQVRAILEAAVELKQAGGNPKPEIMIPLVGDVRELRRVKEVLLKVVEDVTKQAGTDVHYKFGTMIEVPRAALTAGQIAEEAEFFSFGTNDLTQTTYGFSRDDAEGKFLGFYQDAKLITNNPFQVLDEVGVGRLIRIAVEEGRATRPDLEVGICGEHGGDPESVEFCHRAGLNYVSSSPFRIPVARLAAAQAVVREGQANASRVSSTA
ncbi:MAG: pyruvate, phosphate dikinase [Chloroflexi bacterium]|nr:pyruvate, phosphate dikinase [Chloroflexota bacterium]